MFESDAIDLGGATGLTKDIHHDRIYRMDLHILRRSTPEADTSQQRVNSNHNVACLLSGSVATLPVLVATGSTIRFPLADRFTIDAILRYEMGAISAPAHAFGGSGRSGIGSARLTSVHLRMTLHLCRSPEPPPIANINQSNIRTPVIRSRPLRRIEQASHAYAPSSSISPFEMGQAGANLPGESAF